MTYRLRKAVGENLKGSLRNDDGYDYDNDNATKQ